ncbi:hypothetical protein XELAEV_18047071mg [Xenopus laevis]|uniref:Uncharacterized protein n=1 Tax=Xenopus laevis TaxID=8355 RepID=A0A974BUF5_XENLA|nr:hypothetical protein XELAEV_18047071mg [Xenopus laevis]
MAGEGGEEREGGEEEEEEGDNFKREEEDVGGLRWKGGWNFISPTKRLLRLQAVVALYTPCVCVMLWLCVYIQPLEFTFANLHLTLWKCLSLAGEREMEDMCTSVRTGG